MGSARIVPITSTPSARDRDREVLKAYRDQLKRELEEVERRLEPVAINR
jgi:hypothetical protein